MKKSSSVKSDFVMPIVVLGVICLVITALLALTNSATEPVIKKAAQERAEAARAEIIPDADGFELLEVEGLPENVDEVYGTTNDVGYIFMLSPMGYGGEMNLILGMNNDGTIIDVNTLKHSETKGMGSKTAEEPFRSQFRGKDEKLEGVDAITGATISSKAYLGAVADAFTAFNMITGEGKAQEGLADASAADQAGAEDETGANKDDTDQAGAEESGNTDAPAAEKDAAAAAERRAL